MVITDVDGYMERLNVWQYLYVYLEGNRGRCVINMGINLLAYLDHPCPVQSAAVLPIPHRLAALLS